GPKAVVHLHGDLLACRHYGLDVLQIGDEDRILATSRLFFAYALGNGLLIPFYAGARTYLDPAWPEPQAVADALREFAPTLFFSVPTFYGRLLRAGLPADAQPRLLESAGRFTSGVRRRVVPHRRRDDARRGRLLPARRA